MQRDLAPGEGLAQILFQCPAGEHVLTHLFVKQRVPGAARALRTVERDIGAAQEIAEIVAVGWRPRDPDTGRGLIVRSSTSNGRAKQDRSFCASRSISSSFVTGNCRTANSSPPSRATNSPLRQTAQAGGDGA